MIQQSHAWVYIKKNLKSESQRDMCAPMFIPALFTIVKEDKYPLIDKCVKKMCHIHTVECYSAIKKEGNTVTC